MEAPQENQPVDKPQNFEVHTMPQKFLSARPAFKSSKSKKPHKTMGLKTNLIIGLIVIVLFAGLLILAAWLFLRSFNEPKAQPILLEQNIQLNDTIDVTDPVLATTTLDNLEEQQRLKDLLDVVKWQTVENQNYKYTFKFPATWQKTTPILTEAVAAEVIKDEEGVIYFELLIFDNSDQLTLDDWLISDTLLQEDLEDFTLNGQAGYTFEEADNKYIIATSYNNNFYKLTFIESDDSLIKQLNNKILINFKFIEVEEIIIDPEAPVYVPAMDTDHDGLTDVEETLYGSNKLKRDTDGDSYTDGEEIANLYHPAIAGNVKIYERDVVATYVNADYHYNLIYPAVWKVKDESDSVILQDATGEFIQVLVTTNDKNYDDITNWYQANINLDIDSLTDFTVSGIPAIRTPDGYAVYFLLGDDIYTLLYNINLRQDANFMTTFDMAIKSFKLMTSN